MSPGLGYSAIPHVNGTSRWDVLDSYVRSTGESNLTFELCKFIASCPSLIWHPAAAAFTQGFLSVELSEDDIKTVIDTLEYDGLVENIEGEDTDRFRRSLVNTADTNAFTDTPCGVCPVRLLLRCHAFCVLQRLMAGRRF